MTPSPPDDRLERAEAAILALLRERGVDATICPSEAARLLDRDHWRELMPDVHAAAARLVSVSQIVIMQGGRVVEPAGIRGPVRLKRI